MKEALERQKQQEPEGGESVPAEKNSAEEDRPSASRRPRYHDGEEEAEEKVDTYGTKREEKGPEEVREEEEVAPAGGGEAEEEKVEDGPRGSSMRDQVSHLFSTISIGTQRRN